MKLIIDFIVGVVAFLAVTAMSQLGIDLNRVSQPLEIKRLPACSVIADKDEQAPSAPNCH